MDAHVGAHIFEALLTPSGLLRNSARILVTHGLQVRGESCGEYSLASSLCAQYVARADEVVVMDRGRIVERGAYCDLIRADGSVMASLARTFAAEAAKMAAAGDSAVAASASLTRPVLSAPASSAVVPASVAASATVSAAPNANKTASSDAKAPGRIVRDEDRARGTVPLSVCVLVLLSLCT